MEKNTLWSLRLGFSSQQTEIIKRNGLKVFLKSSFQSKFNKELPTFLRDQPKSLNELRTKRRSLNEASNEQKEMQLRENREGAQVMKAWWIDSMRNQEYPLREKMVLFWHNHYVATVQKVKVNYWIYQHNQTLRENAFGNFRELTKKMVTTNAMVRYLDNVDNKKDEINENLSRELLELFTLGINNYKESDVKNGATALAGLGIGENQAEYRRLFESNVAIEYFGKKGKYKSDDLVDIIFEQPSAPYLITRKLLKWFIYDEPKEALVKYYGDFLREVDYEIEPLLTKIFSEEFEKETAGSKIKDPLVYILQLVTELHQDQVDSKAIAFFCQQQGMDLFNQPNVKGWDGGRNWLTSQMLLQRNQISDLICSGRSLNQRGGIRATNGLAQRQPKLLWNNNAKAKEIISELSARYLFQTDSILEEEMKELLKYDFDPKSENADQVVLRLFNFISKTPEFQLI